MVGAEIDVVSKRRQNCIVVMYNFKRNAIFPILPCWFWNACFSGEFSVWREIGYRKYDHPLAGDKIHQTAWSTTGKVIWSAIKTEQSGQRELPCDNS